MEAKIRHLEMIQGAISQSTGNSLRIKGFAMLLLVGAVALLLSGDGGSAIPVYFGLVLLALVVVLAILDYHFLREADMFRILYNQVQAQSDNTVDFSMDSAKYSKKLETQYTEHPPLPIVATVCFYLCGFAIVFFGTFPSF